MAMTIPAFGMTFVQRLQPIPTPAVDELKAQGLAQVAGQCIGGRVVPGPGQPRRIRQGANADHAGIVVIAKGL